MSPTRSNQPTSQRLSSEFKTAALLISSATAWFVIGLSACSQPQPKVAPEQLTTTDDGHGLHTIDNQRLQGLMEELKRIQFEDVAEDLAAGSARAERIESVAQVAARLAGDARMIPQVYKYLELNDESRRAFDNLAAQLQEQCQELGVLARRHQSAAMRAKVNEIITTCNSCHASFREPALAYAPPAKPPY